VTLDAAVSVDATWLAYRLRYVRLASDIEKGRFIVENRMAREIRVVELPEEYAVIETQRAPVWLIHLLDRDAGREHLLAIHELRGQFEQQWECVHELSGRVVARRNQTLDDAATAMRGD
jgi:hypothetical protein